MKLWRAYSHLYIRSNVCKFTIILKIGYCLRLRDIAILYVDSMQKNSVRVVVVVVWL